MADAGGNGGAGGGGVHALMFLPIKETIILYYPS
jgi:hypothetical protein